MAARSQTTTEHEAGDEAPYSTINRGSVSNLVAKQINNGPIIFASHRVFQAGLKSRKSSDRRAIRPIRIRSDTQLSYDIPLTSPESVHCNPFVGRHEELRELHHALQASSRSQVIIRGLGGIGKSALAREYVKTYHTEYSAVFWVNAKDMITVRHDYAAIKNKIQRDSPATSPGGDEDDPVAFVHTWLNRAANRRWLMVFDNLDLIKLSHTSSSDTVDLKEVIPCGPHGRIILTTRASHISGTHVIRLKKISSDEQALEILAAASDRHLPHVKGTETEQLLRELDGLPLALVSAGSFLRQGNVSFARYLQYYRSSWARLHNSGPRILTYEDRTLHTTWNISFDLILQQNPQAANLLVLCGFLDNNDIWYELVKPPATLVGYKWLEQAVEDELSFLQCLRVLSEHGLIETKSADNSTNQLQGFAIHNCVHAWLAHGIQPELREGMIHVALALVTAQILPDSSPGFWIGQRRIFAHALRLWELLTDTLPELTLDPGQLYRLGALFHRNSNLVAAAAFFRASATASMRKHGLDDGRTLGAVRCLATVKLEQGSADEAIEILQHLRLQLESVPVSIDADNRALQALGRAYTESGNIEIAQTYLISALDICSSHYGPEHPYTFGAMNNLANVFHVQKEYGPAESLLVRALAMQQQTLGPSDPRTIGTLLNLGKLYRAQGHYAEAERIYRRGFEEYRTIFGTRNRWTIVAQVYIGVTCAKQEEHITAISRLQQAQEMIEDLGETIPGIIPFIRKQIFQCKNALLESTDKEFRFANEHATVASYLPGYPRKASVTVTLMDRHHGFPEKRPRRTSLGPPAPSHSLRRRYLPDDFSPAYWHSNTSPT
ncbi:P-loop containing nucleoside triphosphate hydrolase protein [Elsinoe ampelina]|uniref:P-loop containing nucleoside triphosphate hydrolase protein n=1 Tax=Elsinoe ampelina TaxID=302913 RepID=A0A6A6G2B0_9PEZI|nr:P-loop containing nucleoside triphosphate hydrolase protein [Elsinoe ampelina]